MREHQTPDVTFAGAVFLRSGSSYISCVEFFRIKKAAAIQLFGQVMGKTLHHLLKHEETHIESWFDSLSVVLCCRLIN